MSEKFEFKHYSVLLNESIDGLNIDPCGIYVDGTLGGAGHSFEICRRLTGGKLIAIDQDEDALEASRERLREFGDKVIFVKNNFCNITEILNGLDIDKIDGMIMDLGVSSYQLDNKDRGFSYMHDAPLDMRMDRQGALNAKTVVNGYSQQELSNIIYRYGEEKFAGKIAAAIVRAREEKEIETTLELSEIIRSAIGNVAKKEKQHPAKRTFQAIRIEVNNELQIIEKTIRDAVERMNSGGRIAIITFHSLEDRIVKSTYKDLTIDCECPKDFPVCVCSRERKVKIITSKPIIPGEKELEENPRSRSAKLRVCERI